MKIKLYKYALMTMSFMLGFHFCNTIINESYIAVYEPYYFYIESVAEIKQQMIIANVLTLIYCLILIGIAVGLYFAELYICIYIDNMRKIT